MQLNKYMALLRQWWWLILLGAVVTGGVTYALNRRQTPQYRAVSSFVIDSGSNSAVVGEYVDIIRAQTLAQDYARMMTVSDVLDDVALRLSNPWPDMPTENPGTYLQGSVGVNAVEDSQIINISAVDSDPVRAAEIADLVGIVFNEQNIERQRLRYTQRIEQDQLQLDELDGLLSFYTDQITTYRTANPDATTSNDPELSRLDRTLNETQVRYTEVFDSVKDISFEEERNRDNVQIIQRAALGLQISPNTRTNTLIATLLGIMAAVGIITLIDFLDDTVKSPDEVRDLTGLSTLAGISFIDGEVPSDRLVSYIEPRAPVSEAYRLLRTNLSFSAVGVENELNSMLITSSSPSEGKSTTSANLAVVMAQAGKRVVIVDADLRRPSQDKIFNVANNKGLTTAIIDSENSVNDHLQMTMIPGLQIMTSGPLPPNPSELLNSTRMQDVIASLQEIADFVLIDTPPVLTVADAAILAPKVDGALLVLEVGRTRKDAVVKSREQLQNNNAHLVGVVMNRSRQGGIGYYDYYYTDQSYAYANDKPQRRPILGWLTGK